MRERDTPRAWPGRRHACSHRAAAGLPSIVRGECRGGRKLRKAHPDPRCTFRHVRCGGRDGDGVDRSMVEHARKYTDPRTRTGKHGVGAGGRAVGVA
jgi:hypothetical protein